MIKIKRKHGHNQQFINNCKIMLIYKINKEQIMKNLFTFPKDIFTEHLYVTYHIYIDRYKQYLTDIEKLRILTIITSNHVSNK